MANLTRWNPFDEIANLWPRDLFGRVRPDGGLEVEWSPRCDVTERDGELVVHAELPGVEANDIDVSISGSNLVVKGEKRSEKKTEEDGRTYSERFFGSFERTISIPEGVDASAIAATLKDGVLEVTVPLPATPQPEVKRIEIKAG